MQQQKLLKIRGVTTGYQSMNLRIVCRFWGFINRPMGQATILGEKLVCLNMWYPPLKYSTIIGITNPIFGHTQMTKKDI